MQSVMRNVFGFSDGFKSEHQRLAYEAISAGKKNVIISMKTHGGKSAAYMIVGALQETGIILVISPCLALLKNHCDYLNGIELTAEYLLRDVSGQARSDLLDKLRYLDDTKFFYVTPEMILKSRGDGVRTFIEEMCLSGKITHVILDEVIRDATFRSVEHLTELRAASGSTPWIVLTTASDQLIEEYKVLLGVTDPEIIRGPCDRNDIFYEVVGDKTCSRPSYETVVNDIRALLAGSKTTSGIVFTDFNQHVCGIVEALKQSGIRAEAHYANYEHRFEVQERWTRGEFPVLVATSESIGYGLIKSPIAFVFHYGSPKNDRTFYLESGRACGKGMLRSRIYPDYASWQPVGAYSCATTCRHRFIANHFNDADNSSVDCGNMCDNCIRNANTLP